MPGQEGGWSGLAWPYLLASASAVLMICGVWVRSSRETSQLESTTNAQGRYLVGQPIKPDLSEAKQKLQELLSLIRNRYELSGPIGPQFFLTANNIDSDAWDVLKYKFAVRMLQNNTGNDYLMIFGGSSVTASHDNFYNQSYPAIFERRMGPVFKALGINLVVHNIAMGANNCLPYQFCYESMGGLDPEFIGWEQSYNCGHDEPIFELAARVAGFSKKKAVIYYSASGAWAPGSCPNSVDKVPYSNEDWTPEVAGLPAWKPSEKDVLNEKTLLDKYARAKGSSMRFHPFSAGGHYKAVAPMGFNVWEGNPNCKTRDKDDTKDVTGCNGIDAAQGCKMKFMTKEAASYGSDNGKGANWHPTRAFHMMRGEMIAWLWGLAMLDAVYTVEGALGTGSAPEALLKQMQTKLDALQPALPSPKKCQNLHCEAKPTCYTDFKPHYSPNLRLKDIVVGRTNWTYEAEDYQDWSLHYGYLDAKPLYQAHGNQGAIHLRVTVGNIKSIWLCGNRKEGLKHTEIFLDRNPKFLNPTDYQPSIKQELWSKKKVTSPDCISVDELPPGNHVLSIDTNKAPDKHIHDLSHVVSWP